MRAPGTGPIIRGTSLSLALLLATSACVSGPEGSADAPHRTAAQASRPATGATSPLAATTQPSPVPTTDATATDTAAPTRDPSLRPPHPALPTQPDEAAAARLMRYFLSLYEYAYETGDVRDLRRVSHPECVFCGSVIDGATEDHAAGRTSDGGTLRITHVNGVAISEEAFRVDVQMIQEPGSETEADGTTTRFSRKSYQLEAAIRVDKGRLVVRAVSFSPIQIMTTRHGSPATSKPRSPTPLTEEGADGGMAVAAQYALLHTYARATGDARPMTALASDQCDECPGIEAAAAKQGATSPLDPDTIVAVKAAYATGQSPTQQYSSLLITERTEPVDNSTFELSDGLPAIARWSWQIVAVYERGRWRIQWASGTQAGGTGAASQGAKPR